MAKHIANSTNLYKILKIFDVWTKKFSVKFNVFHKLNNVFWCQWRVWATLKHHLNTRWNSKNIFSIVRFGYIVGHLPQNRVLKCWKYFCIQNIMSLHIQVCSYLSEFISLWNFIVLVCFLKSRNWWIYKNSFLKYEFWRSIPQIL